MKDIGLGVLDPYTVVIVLVTLVLANVLFGYQIPLDTTNAIQLFVSLVIFTGYVYVARSAIRMPVAALKSWIILGERVGKAIIAINKTVKEIERINGFVSWLLKPFYMVFLLGFIPLVFLMYLINFAEKDFDENFQSEKIKTIRKKTWVEYILGFLDRIGVLFIAIFAIIPAFQIYVHNIGIFGIFFMIGVFLLKGSFVALIEDGLVKVLQGKNEEKKQDSEKENMPKDENGPSSMRLGQIPIKISRCEICGKICTDNGYGRIQKLCSLACRQKWFENWEKDWCIGEGQERQLLNSLRISGYSDYPKIEKVIDLLNERLRLFLNEEAAWALIAIARDSDRIFRYSYRQEIQESILEIMKQNLQSIDHIAYVLTSCLTDESVTIANLAAQTIATDLKPQYIPDNYIKALLKNEDNNLRSAAIRILAKLGKAQELAAHLGKTVNTPDDYEIMELLSSIQPPAIDVLKNLQINRNKWVREQATKILNELGIDSKEPRFVLDSIRCPECKEELSIKIPSDKYVLKVSKTSFLQRYFQRGSIIKCLFCEVIIDIKFAEYPQVPNDMLIPSPSGPTTKPDF